MAQMTASISVAGTQSRERRLVEMCFALWDQSIVYRNTHEPAIQDLQIYGQPFRGNLTTDQPEIESNEMRPVHETTLMDLNHKLGNALFSRMFPPDAEWLRHRPNLRRRREPLRPSEENALAIAIEGANEKINDVIDRSNFYEEVPVSLSDLRMHGNGNCSVNPEGEDGDVSFQAIDFFRQWAMLDNNGRPRMIFTKYHMTAWEAYQRFKGDAGERINNFVKRGHNTSMAEYVEILHVLYKRDEHKMPGGLPETKTKLPWVSVWLDIEHRAAPKPIKESGMKSLRYAITRWMRRNGEPYGHGLGHIARSDAAGLNASFEQYIEAWAREINPPLAVESDSWAGGGGDWGPAGFITVRRPQFMQPNFLTTGTNFSASFELIDKQQENLGRIMLSELFSVPESQERSARATMERVSMQTSQLSTLAVVTGAHLRQSIAATTSIMDEKNALPELDVIEEITGVREMLPVFVSPFFADQRRAAVSETLNAAAATLELANLAGEGELREAIHAGFDPDGLRVAIGESAADHRIYRTEEETEQFNADRAARNFEERQAALAGAGGNINLSPRVDRVTGVPLG